MFGLFRSSRSTGLTICLTEMRRTSSVVRNEKEMLFTVEGYDLEIFMLPTARKHRTSRFRRTRRDAARTRESRTRLCRRDRRLREFVELDAQFSPTQEPRADGSLTEIVARSPPPASTRRDNSECGAQSTQQLEAQRYACLPGLRRGSRSSHNRSTSDENGRCGISVMRHGRGTKREHGSQASLQPMTLYFSSLHLRVWPYSSFVHLPLAPR